MAGAVEKFVVEPTNCQKKQNICNTASKAPKCLFFKQCKTIQFPANNNLTIEDLQNNPEVIDNIRINDQEPLIQVYNQLQGIRPYYVFNDVDVDRYVIDGDYKQVFVSERT